MMVAVVISFAEARATPLYYWDFNNPLHPLQPSVGNAQMQVFLGDIGFAVVTLPSGTTLNALPGTPAGYALGEVSAVSAYEIMTVTMTNLDFRNHTNIQMTFATRAFDIGLIENFSVQYRINNGSWSSHQSLNHPTTAWSIYQVDFGSVLDNQENVSIRLTYDNLGSVFNTHELDNVQIIPEPTSLAGWTIGLMGVLAFLRRRSGSSEACLARLN